MEKLALENAKEMRSIDRDTARVKPPNRPSRLTMLKFVGVHLFGSKLQKHRRYSTC